MRKITSLLMLLCMFVGTAWADLTQNYYKNTNFWSAATIVPDGVQAVLKDAMVGQTAVKKDGGVIQWSNNEITVTDANDVVVTFTHNGGDHMLNILGVDVVDAEGNVVKSDYHHGTAGGNPTYNEYTLEGLTAGVELTLRCFVYDNTGTGDRTNSAQGYYKVTNVTGEPIVVVKPAVNLENGKYIFRQAGGDVALYNATDVARGKNVADAGDVNHVFTITKGDGGYYTIQAVDGKYVTYKGTGNTSTLVFAEAANATDDNKWWAIREGNGASQRIIVPKTNDVYDAPGWNYAKSVGGTANQAVALWSSSDNGSQWYITKAPILTEGYAKVKVAGHYLSVDNDRIVKNANGDNSVLKFTKGEKGYTIQTLDEKFLTYKKNNENGDQIELSTGADVTEDNKWWVLTYDLGTRKDAAIDAIPCSANPSNSSPAFNWSVGINGGSNNALGLWTANDDNSYLTIEECYVTPQVGDFVAFQSASSSNYCSGKYVRTVPAVKKYSGGGYEADRDHTQLVFDVCDPANTPSAIFEIIASSKPYEYKLKNVHTQEYVISFVKGANHMGTQEDAVVIKFVNLGENQVAVYGANNSNPMHAQDAYSVIVTWGGGANTSSAWYIQEVENFAHTLSVGAAGWSTLMLGFNATIPDDVEVYAVSDVNATSATLAPVTGVIPANEPVLVKAEQADYNFEYATAAESLASNLLEGSLYDKNIKESAYVLAKYGEELGFFLAKMNKEEETAFLNNANKAYLPASAVPAGARFLSFDFGNETAIESIEGAENGANSVIYDLSGRRVQKTQKGLYIVNGVKVIK